MTTYELINLIIQVSSMWLTIITILLSVIFFLTKRK